MKRYLAVLAFALVGCSDKNEDDQKEVTPQQITSMLNEAFKSEETWTNVAKKQRERIYQKKDDIRKADQPGEISVLTSELEELTKDLDGYEAKLAEIHSRIADLRLGRVPEGW